MNEYESRSQIFEKGHILFHQNVHNDKFSIIFEGVIKLYSICENGKCIIHGFLTKGDFVGVPALSENTISLYTAEVIEDARIYMMERPEAMELLKTDPNFTSQIFTHMIKAQDEAYHRHDHLINCKVRERTAKCLLELAECFGEKINRDLRIKLRLNREELASVIGVAPETAIRFLSEFRKRGIISEKDRQIVITDIEALINITK